jgi:histidine triad (HIT) family protein
MSIFSKIIAGEIPAYKVAENDDYLAFLDIFPLQAGHVLVVPKVEVDYIFDLDDDVFTGLMLFSKQVAEKIKAVIPCNRIGVTIIGLEVPHAHVHLIPISRESDMNFAQAKKKFTPDEMEVIAKKIREA